MTLKEKNTSSSISSLFQRNIITFVFYNRDLLVFLTIVPVGYIFLFGYAFSALFTSQGLGQETISIGTTTVSYITFLASGGTTFIIMECARLVGLVVQKDKMTGMMKQILVMPFSKYDYVAALILLGVITTFMGTLIILAAGSPVLSSSVHYTLVGVLYVIYGILTGAIIFSSICIMLALYIKSNENFHLVVSAALLFFVPALSPTWYPLVDELPEIMKYAFYMNPMTHLIDIIRAGMFNQINATINIQVVIIALISIVLFFVSIRLLLGDRKHYE
jgi:ABC-2 type transport system permease protein